MYLKDGVVMVKLEMIGTNQNTVIINDRYSSNSNKRLMLKLKLDKKYKGEKVMSEEMNDQMQVRRQKCKNYTI